MPTPISGVTPALLGQAVFGDPAQMTASVFTGTAAQQDAFLGLATGTTRYAPCPNGGGAFALTGVLTGATSADVVAAQAALSAMAGLNAGLAILPTGLSFAGWDPWASVWFNPGDLVYSTAGIVAGPGGTWQIGYSLILHRVGGTSY